MTSSDQTLEIDFWILLLIDRITNAKHCEVYNVSSLKPITIALGCREPFESENLIQN